MNTRSPHDASSKSSEALPSCSASLCHFLHFDDVEFKRHIGFIESLAEEMCCETAEIIPLYEKVLEALSANARVSDYVPTFVYRRVKRILSGNDFSC